MILCSNPPQHHNKPHSHPHPHPQGYPKPSTQHPYPSSSPLNLQTTTWHVRSSLRAIHALPVIFCDQYARGGMLRTPDAFADLSLHDHCGIYLWGVDGENVLSISFDTFTPISTNLSWLILPSKSRTNRSNTSTRYGRLSGWSKNSKSFCVNWCHSLYANVDQNESGETRGFIDVLLGI